MRREEKLLGIAEPMEDIDTLIVLAHPIMSSHFLTNETIFISRSFSRLEFANVARIIERNIIIKNPARNNIDRLGCVFK